MKADHRVNHEILQSLNILISRGKVCFAEEDKIVVVAVVVVIVAVILINYLPGTVLIVLYILMHGILTPL